jgi:hypothetical protein
MTQEVFERIVNEFNELNSKIEKLRDFILKNESFSKLDNLNRDLLITQLKAMETYVSILSIRIGLNSSQLEQSEQINTLENNE